MGKLGLSAIGAPVVSDWLRVARDLIVLDRRQTEAVKLDESI